MATAKSVMVVDDSLSVRQMMVGALKGAGYSLMEAGSGREALDQIDAKAVDMVITDLNMPGMSGIELVEAVRGRPGHRFVPIVMLSSEKTVAKREEAKKAGASAWIAKPFKAEQLLSLVRVILP